ncbi:MAG: HXXEE domain-containing protein [Bacteroidota bacterium]
MNNGTLLSISILLLFAMLWFPLGQTDFLVEHWMKIGTYAIPFMFLGIFSFLKEEKGATLIRNLRFLSVVMLVAYILHQFEEHWIDIYGNEYAFYIFNNNFLLSNLGADDSNLRPLTKESIFVINTSLVWLVGLIALLRSPQRLFPFFAMAGIILVNGLVHIMAGVATWSYNPGILSSIILFIPLYLWVVQCAKDNDNYARRLLILGLIWAILAHVIMVGGLLMANWFHYIPEYVYWIALVIWSIVPLLSKK